MRERTPKHRVGNSKHANLRATRAVGKTPFSGTSDVALGGWLVGSSVAILWILRFFETVI